MLISLGISLNIYSIANTKVSSYLEISYLCSMNQTKKRQRIFRKSLVIKTHDLILKVKADYRNPHWHDSVDKWSREWGCVIYKNNSSYGVYGPIDQDSGQCVADGVYVVEFSKYSGIEIETRRIKDIDIIKIDNYALK